MKKFLYSLLAVGVICLSGFIGYVYFSSYSAFVDADSRQTVTAQEYIQDTSNKGIHYTVFYKRGCSTCKEWSDDIVSAFDSMEVDKSAVSYVESSEGIPSEVASAFSSIDFSQVHMPYVVRSQYTPEGKLVVTWSARVNNKEALNKLTSFYTGN